MRNVTDSEKCQLTVRNVTDSKKCQLTVKNVTDSEKCLLTVKIVTCEHLDINRDELTAENLNFFLQYKREIKN